MATCTVCNTQDVTVQHIKKCWEQHYEDGGKFTRSPQGTFTNTEFGGEAPARALRHLFGINRDNRQEGKQAVKDAIGRWPRWNRDDIRWEIMATDEEWGLIPDQWKEGPETLKDGIYRLERGDLEDQTYFMVYHTVHGANQQVAKKLILEQLDHDAIEHDGGSITGDPIGTWEYVGQSPLKHLKPEMMLDGEEGAKFGQVYGWCYRCGRTLTNEESKKAGIGPVCAGKE